MATTSHAAEGRTVDKVFIGESSFPATNQRSFYVPVTRGREQAVIFTDDNKKELLWAVQRPDQPLSAMGLAQATKTKMRLRPRVKRHLAYLRRMASFAEIHDRRRQAAERANAWQKEQAYGR